MADSDTPQQNDSAFPLFSILLLTSIFYISFVSRVLLAPLLPVIEKDLGLGHGQAGSLFFYIGSGYGLGLIGAGFVSAALNHRGTLLLSTLLMGMAMFAVSLSQTGFQMHAGLVLAGLATAFYLPSGVSTMTELVQRKNWGKAIAIHELAPNLGFITAPILAELFLKIFSWRGALAAIGVASFGVGIFFLSFGQGGRQKGAFPNLKLMHKILLTSGLWMMAIFFTVAAGSSMGIYTMMPLYLVSEIGMEREWANTLIGLSRTFGVAVIFFSGLLTDRIGPKRAAVIFITAAGVITILLGILKGPVSLPVIIFLQAASTTCLFPVGFAIISLLFPQQIRNVGVSTVFLISFPIGGGLFPMGIGYWAEAFSFSSGIAIVGSLLFIVLFIFHRGKDRLNLTG